MSLIFILKRKSKKTFFTTPSHNQKFCLYHKFYQWYKNDISEVDDYNPQIALEYAEKRASEIYKTKSTHFLTNGSTSGVIASVLACCKPNDTVLIWNNAHPCHKNACKLARVNVIEYEQYYDSEWGVFKPLDGKKLIKLIEENSPNAVIITSPTYEGFVCDIATISEICKKNKVFLIVDEAHGALYPFSEKLPQSAIEFADFTIQSLHKTAGGINPTALLHCNCECDVKKTLQMITTTSPSYPMLATIEANILFLNSKRGQKYIENLISELESLKSNFKELINQENDITKILIKHPKFSGEEISEFLYKDCNIEDEKTNKISTLAICGIGTTSKNLCRLKNALQKMQKM